MIRRVLLLFALLLLAGCSAVPERINNRGNRAFERQAYSDALRDYLMAQAALPGQPEPAYNAANTHYRQGDLLAAQQRMLAAQARISGTLNVANKTLLHNSHYNLGNIYFRMSAYARAVESYKDALRLNPDDVDAKHNLELALERLQQAMEEQPQADALPEATPEIREPEPTQPGSEDQQPTPGQDVTSAEVPTLTPEEARELLESAGNAAQTLQNFLQEPFPAPGRPPEQDW
jgi:Ca-activated chloride channel homolog